MANIHIEKDHQLGIENARVQVEELARSLKDELQIDFEWKDNRLVFERLGASGTIDVGADHIDIDVELGLALSMIRGVIEERINQRLEAAFG
jgi:putative polyhydroxyalkanoate system protein